LTNKRNGTLYIGVTAYLPRRIFEHQNKIVEGFSKDYGCDMLVYYELYDMMEEAITREKQMKKWNREWKIELIEKSNPGWNDLSKLLV
jgi:putative endonuclease